VSSAREDLKKLEPLKRLLERDESFSHGSGDTQGWRCVRAELAAQMAFFSGFTVQAAHLAGSRKLAEDGLRRRQSTLL